MCTHCGCGRPDDEVEHEHRLPDGDVGKHAHGVAPLDSGPKDEFPEELWFTPETRAAPLLRPSSDAARQDFDGVVLAWPHHLRPAPPPADDDEEDELPRLPDARERRLAQLGRELLARNDAQAARNRRRFEAGHTLVLNLLSSPGSGKTTLLVRTLVALAGRVPVAVIEGDQQTSLDAERVRAAGALAVQVNTGADCHLDAQMVARAALALPALAGGILFVENVGNLVCPASFDLGEAAKVVILSVTEGEDKPLKYPDLFAVADLVLVNKVDLLPHVDVSVLALEANLRRVNPGVEMMVLSARTGLGCKHWLDWLQLHLPRRHAEAPAHLPH
ncbi:MAG: hypothetical protein AMXMBFR34_18750 [Myxococcaceae bacterium]